MSWDDDRVWRRPSADEPPGVEPDHGYPGPPAAAAPPPNWQPPVAEQVTTPRTLPRLDDLAIDLAEERAARLTYGLGAAAVLVLAAAVCVRNLI